MAMDRLTGSAVLRAHQTQVNGCSSFQPDLDNAREVLSQAHAVLVIVNEAVRDGVVNKELIASAYSGIETLLEAGIRATAIGHADLIAELH